MQISDRRDVTSIFDNDSIIEIFRWKKIRFFLKIILMYWKKTYLAFRPLFKIHLYPRPKSCGATAGGGSEDSMRNIFEFMTHKDAF